MTINSDKRDFLVKEGLLKGYKLWDLYKSTNTIIMAKKIIYLCKKIKMPCFGTPYDEEGVEILKKLNAKLYKISSFEMKDESLVKKICRLGKPVIISTGLANLKEIEKIYKIAKKSGCKKLVLLYCVSSYPAKNSDFNLNNIELLKKNLNVKLDFRIILLIMQ